MSSRRLLFGLFALALATSVLVMPAVNAPVTDVDARLRATHWMWTGQMDVAPVPPVSADPEQWRWPNGVPGVDGTIHHWFGIGQSLLMLPADILATAVGNVFPPLSGAKARALMVWYLCFPLFSGLGVLAAFHLLRSLDVSQPDAMLGALALLFATTYLWHVQNIQENTQLFFFTAAAFWATLRWARTQQPRWLTIAALLVGFNLLIRLPALADVAGVCLFAVFLGRGRVATITTVALRFLPPLVLYACIDRLYHWYRFGTWTGTYMALKGDAMRRLNPGLSPDFPFNGPFMEGFVGAYLSPAKSIFIYDPLLTVALVLTVWHWKQLSFEWRAYIGAVLAILLVTTAGYAIYYNWESEAAWGNRFVTTPVIALALLAVPLARHARLPRVAFGSLAALAVAMQLASLVFPSWAELVQNGGGQERMSLLPGCAPPAEYFVLGQRIQNIWLWFTTGATAATCDGHPTGTPLALWGLLPFRSLPGWASVLIRTTWVIGCLLVAVATMRLYRAAKLEPVRHSGDRLL